MSLHQGQRLAVFAPKNLAQALRRETPEPNRPPSPSRPPTLTVDIASVAKGAVLVGEFFLRQAAQKRARASELRNLSLELAEQFHGFLGIPDLIRLGECTLEQAERCLKNLEHQQICRYLCRYRDEALYVFPAFLSRVWSCDYCTSEFPVAPSQRPLEACCCPNCGAVMGQRIAESRE